MDILDQILKTKYEEIAAAVVRRSFAAVYEEARSVARPVLSLSQALCGSPAGIIAEFKRRSPSKGFIREGADAAAVTGGYAASGAAAISVLTDRNYFGGTLDDLRAARRAADVPLLRKDFIIDPYQLCEARIAGADAVLLIASALTPERCAGLAAFARSLGLEVLLELHGESELDYLDAEVDVVGINNRNLKTFVTDTAVSERLAGMIPPERLKISESGISSPVTVRRLREAGFRGFLMGENFMKEPDPAEALRRFIAEAGQ